VTSLLLRPDEPATLSAPLVRGPRQPRTAPVERGGTSTALLEPDEVWSPEGPSDPDRPGAAATKPTAPRRPPRPLEGEPNVPTPWWQRLRSLVELVSIAVVLGVLTAAAIGLAVVALFGLLRGSVG